MPHGMKAGEGKVLVIRRGTLHEQLSGCERIRKVCWKIFKRGEYLHQIGSGRVESISGIICLYKQHVVLKEVNYPHID